MNSITSQEEFFNKVLAAESNALVEVCTPWNGACQLIAGTVAAQYKIHQGKLNFFSVNLEANPFLTKLYGVETLPTLLFFQNGILVDKITGLVNGETISQKIKTILNS